MRQCKGCSNITCDHVTDPMIYQLCCECFGKLFKGRCPNEEDPIPCDVCEIVQLKAKIKELEEELEDCRYEAMGEDV